MHLELKKINRRLAKAVGEDKEKLDLELLYTTYYPTDMKYLSLYPTTGISNQVTNPTTGSSNPQTTSTTPEIQGEEDGRLYSEQQIAIMDKIKEMNQKGLLNEGFTWRFNVKEAEVEKVVARETDDFFL